MRPFAALLSAALLASAAGAQHPGAYPADRPVLGDVPLIPPPPTSGSLPEGPAPWHLDLVLGLPSGLRLQRTLDRGPWMVEGLVGIELVFPTVGFGVRRQCALFEGTSDALLLNPGLGVYLVYVGWLDDRYYNGPDVGAVILAADVDLAWRHSFSDGFEGQMGLKLGVAAAVGGNGGAVLPVVAWYVGCGF